MSQKNSVYIFGWPSFVGGADTKLADLIRLLHADFNLTLVPNHCGLLEQEHWCNFLKQHGVRIQMADELKSRLEGYALALSNQSFFAYGYALRAKEKGLMVIWSSEMMWHHDQESEALKQGLIDKVLYVSDIQKAALQHAYEGLPSVMTGNFIDPALFPFKPKTEGRFTIGRLSRAALEKYPEDFPVFYERLLLPESRFRVMAWDKQLASKYRWHDFDDRWDLLPAEAEDQVSFLHSLDLFVYPLGHRFTESWGRSTVEAMLAGAVTVVPQGHNFPNLVLNGETGFICDGFEDFRERCQYLLGRPDQRLTMARAAREFAVHNLCDRATHLAIWKEVFN